MKCFHLVSRFANVCLVLVLLFLSGYSISTAALIQQATSAAETSTHLTDLYQQILYAFSVEESVEHEYALEPGTSLRNEHLAAADTLRVLLQRLQQDGAAEDRALVNTLFAEQERYLLFADQFFAAVDAHNLALAHSIHTGVIDSLFEHITRQVQQAANEDQAEASNDLAQLSQLQSITFVMTPVVFVIGLLLIAISGGITRTYRKKIDEARQVEMARLERMALTDPLTNLGNHYAYQEYLSHALEEARADGDPLGLALLDLDEFKIINDEQGHQRGDEVLLALASLLREAKVSDALFRLSGDDFAVILPRTSLAEATLALERLREIVDQRSLGVTVSIGLAHSGSGETSLELLQAQARAALQEVKRSGRNRVLSFEEIRGRVSIVPSAKIQSLRQLLSERKLTIAFQPIWNLTTGSVLAFEALARPAADYGFTGPQEMFDIAEHIGRAHELDAVCVQAILARAADLPPDALLFLNLTPQTLVHDLLTAATLLEAVVTAGLTSSRVVLEITERSIVDLAEVVQKVKFLRLLGFRVALDDAGAGNAGLEMLSQLSVDFVKIDRDVVGRALTDQAAHSVLTGIATIARGSHTSVVAEGIENRKMLELVYQLEVQYAQGYLLGYPSETIPESSALQNLSPTSARLTNEAKV